MSEIKYVVRFFQDDQYLYSVHCDSLILDDVVKKAKDVGQNVKIIAYKSDEE